MAVMRPLLRSVESIVRSSWLLAGMIGVLCGILLSLAIVPGTDTDHVAIPTNGQTVCPSTYSALCPGQTGGAAEQMRDGDFAGQQAVRDTPPTAEARNTFAEPSIERIVGPGEGLHQAP
jgi:hypothetical protein